MEWLVGWTKCNMETEIERYVPCRYLAGVLKRFDRERAVRKIHYIAPYGGWYTVSNHAYALLECQLKSYTALQPPFFCFFVVVAVAVVIPFYFVCIFIPFFSTALLLLKIFSIIVSNTCS